MSDIRKRTGKNGTTYQVRYPTTKTKSGYAYATFATRKEALDFRENSGSLKTGHRPHRDIRTVAQGLQKWLDVCEKEGRDGRVPVTLNVVKNYAWRRDLILAYDWQKSLHDLTPPDIVEFRSWLVQNYSQDLARKLLSSFHSMVLELVKRGVLAHDIAAGISIRGQSRYDQEAVIPTEREIGDLLATADKLANSKNLQIQKSWERYRPMLYLAVDTGMRPQEYIAVPDFNIRDGGVQVDRALEAGGRKISVTKTPAGRRFIELSPHVQDMVLHYSANHGVENNKHRLVFPTSSGHWQNVNNWYRRGFCYVCEKAGLIAVTADGDEKHKYTPYSLRHFYASMLIEQKVNLKRIQKLMGHQGIETTLNVYGHLIERKEAAAEKRTGMLASLDQISCGKSVATGSKAAEIMV
jgi:integrase